MSNNELIQRYLHLCEGRGLTKQTIAGYRDDLRVFLRYINDKPLCTITHFDIENFLFYCQNERGNGTDALVRKYNTINGMYETLIRKDYLDMKNPMYKVDKIKSNRNKIKPYLTKDEIKLLFSYVENKGDLRGLSYLSLTYSSGARISEIVQLNKSSLDFENRQFIVLGKGQVERVCIFSEHAKYATLKYLQSRKDNLEPLYLSRESNRWSKSAIQQYVPKIVKEAGISKHITPHSLRHSVLTNMRLEGMSIEDLQLLAGHKDISTTQRNYTHVGLLDIRDKFDQFYNRNQ